MPFSPKIKEDALVKSRRRCCVCQEFAGRNVNVHHIVPEADGGINELDNAIVLCFRCHAEAGHYNLRHPLGTKYSPTELRRHRDEWWSNYKSDDPGLQPENYARPAESVPREELGNVEKEIGTLWSNYLNLLAQSEFVRFEGKLLAEAKTENMSGVTWWELYQLKDGHYVVYTGHNHNGDWCTGDLAGVNAWDEFDPPLTLIELQERYPALAKAAGLVRVRNFEIDE